MCVRTLTGNEVVSVPTDLPIHHELEGKQSEKPDKLTKAKEKYMKLHDEMVLRERKNEIDREQKTNSDDLLVPEISEDVLAKSTTKFRTFCSKVSNCYSAWQKTKSYQIIFRTIQPAHVIMIAAVLCVASAILPTSERIHIAGPPHSRITSLIYLISFVVHFGSQIWMTFVSGLSLYFALPRHIFSEVQRVLFPRYFTINACLSLTTLLIFVKHHPVHTWDSEIAIQFAEKDLNQEVFRIPKGEKKEGQARGNYKKTIERERLRKKEFSSDRRIRYEEDGRQGEQ